jgi:hypothetical protein
MGSGHFLVSLVDTLADHVLDAMAEAASLARDIDYASPLAGDIEKIRATIRRNAKAADWAIDEAQLDDRHIVRRMVLKRCVYGVDKNPMAVELAKVALWLHTFTVGAPLSFIDHHLRAGDSLFGLWVRDAIDKAGKQGGELLHIGPLREAASAAASMQVIERLTDAEIGEAHKSAETYYGIQCQTAPLDAFVSYLHALDWLDIKDKTDRAAIRAWLDGQFGDPILIMQCKAEPAAKRSGFRKVGSDDRVKSQQFTSEELLERLDTILERPRPDRGGALPQLAGRLSRCVGQLVKRRAPGRLRRGGWKSAVGSDQAPAGRMVRCPPAGDRAGAAGVRSREDDRGAEGGWGPFVG